MTARAQKRLLILKAGDVRPPLLTTHGDYDRWFARVLAGRCTWTVVEAHRGAKLPAVDSFDAVLMTGSPLSVTALAPWMTPAAEYLLQAAEHGRSVLGVCFGHQLLGHVRGAKVVRHPAGREVGSVEIDLTPAGQRDPLFADLPTRFMVQATHEDVVDGLPEGAVALAANAHTALQAMAMGPRVRTVQFHPEIDAATMAALLAARGQEAAVSMTPGGERLLHNFIERF